MNILLAPDKFKGTLSAREVCEALARGIGEQHAVRMLPLADGGEGTQEFFVDYLGGEEVSVPVHDPLMRRMTASYVRSADGATAFVEMARASGLSLLKAEERNPMVTTTLGIGELMRDAIDQGAKHIIIGVGGSATNDGGAGMLCALGAKLYDASGNDVQPVGGKLHEAVRIDASALDALPKGMKFTAICDVQNPFYGMSGAAHVYGPQKGATPEHILLLDEGLKQFARVTVEQTGIDLQHVPGSGAGGGIAGGLHAWLGAELKPGIDVVLELARFREAVAWADVIVTGEGKVDEQTLQGKVVAGVVRLARASGKRVIVVCGQSTVAHDVWPGVEIISLSERFGLERAMQETGRVLGEVGRELIVVRSRLKNC